jgi:GH24 family phage-related lysozyme (muramidase)
LETLNEVVTFVKSWEGCVLIPRPDGVNGAAVIGWGMDYYPNGTPVKVTDTPLTQAQADSMFLEVLQPFVQGVCEALGASISLETKKVVSCTDFAYNLGLGAFKQSVLLQHILTNEVIETDFTEYDHVGTEVDANLLARRKAEYNLYITSTTMEPTQVIETTPQVLEVSQIAVTYTTFVNGVETETARTVDIAVTQDLCTELQKDSSLVAPGWAITVTPKV